MLGERERRGGEAPVQPPTCSFKILKHPLIAMDGKMKDNQGSGQIWNLILSVFSAEAVPNCSRIFLKRVQRVYSLTSAVDSDCSLQQNSARIEHCYGSTRCSMHRQVSKRLPTADHPRNAARNDVRV